VLAVAVHCLPMKVPFGHCAVHGVQFLPLFSRNVFFVQVNEHWFVQLKGPVTGVLQPMHLEIPSSEHGDENMPGTKHWGILGHSRHALRLLLWYKPYLQTYSHSEIHS
jgi:hypothetical protein